MNDLQKVRRILRVCQLISNMPSGGGWVKGSDIVMWSSVPQATTYRYLPKLVKNGLLMSYTEDYRSGTITRYAITQNGHDYLKAFKELV